MELTSPTGSRSPEKPVLAYPLLLAILLLLISGIAYRVVGPKFQSRPVLLDVPLKSFPFQFNGWVGKDIPVPQVVQQVAGNDDFINRMYQSDSRDGQRPRQWVNLYVPYTATPRTMLGHRPQRCYVGSGWVHDQTAPSQFVTGSGRQIPCLIHRFHHQSAPESVRVVLNFYVLNGQVTNNESSFIGMGWRTPNIAGDPARYVAQVQISSVREDWVRAAAVDFTDEILLFFPDQEGLFNSGKYARPVTHNVDLN